MFGNLILFRQALKKFESVNFFMSGGYGKYSVVKLLKEKDFLPANIGGVEMKVETRER